MEDYKEWEKKVKANIKRNEKFIKEFTSWLEEKDLAKKTIKKHINNIQLYLNEYLNYYDITPMEEGIDEAYSYLSGWCIEKCLFASKTTIKENIASIKKFYNCMSELGYVSKEDYKDLCEELNDSIDEILEYLKAYDNGTYYNMFM